MIKPDHTQANATASTPVATSAIRTLGDLRQFIQESPKLKLSNSERSAIASSVKKVDQLVGHGCLDFAADPKTILRRLDKIAPASSGLSRQSFANLKSRVRRAFQLASCHLAPARSNTPLKGLWKDAYALLDTRDQRALSRFLRFAQWHDWHPATITDDHIRRFATYLEDEAAISTWELVTKNTIIAWNRAVEQVDGWRGQALTPPASSRRSYWRNLEAFPQSFQSDLSAFLDHLTSPLNVKRVHQKTAEQNRHAVIALASSLVEGGLPIDEIVDLASVVAPERLKRALHFQFERNGEQVTSFMEGMACRARVIATCWAKLGEHDIHAINCMYDNIRLRRQNARGRTQKRGLSRKNLELLERFDEPRLRDRLLLLPKELMRVAESSARPDRGAATARAAVMIELLLVCALRRENLMTLSLGKTIKKQGTGDAAQWIINIPGDDVKNGQPLRFALDEGSGALINQYIIQWRPILSHKPNDWLFPRECGDHIDLRHASNAIAQQTLKHLGVRITAHQLRHLAADMYIGDNPDGLGVVSQHLGHRDLNTTRAYYVRSKQREASRRFQEHFLRTREGAIVREAPHKRRTSPSKRPDRDGAIEL